MMFKLGLVALLISISFYFVIDNLSFICDSIQNVCDNCCKIDFNDLVGNNVTSSLWCNENTEGHKTCDFNNLCYLPNSGNQFLFMYTNQSVFVGLRSKELLKTISLSSVNKHNGMFIKLVVMKAYKNMLKRVLNIKKKVLLVWRFKWDNIMHVIHDDLFPIYMTYREICKGNIDKCVSKYRLAFVDGGKPGPYYEWYKIFSDSNPLFLSTEKHRSICFQHGRMGLSRESVWYQYGFQQVHGPTNSSTMDGKLLTEFTEFVLRKFKINTEENDVSKIIPKENKNESIAILFSRENNRKILNENEIMEEMSDSFSKIFENKTLEIYKLILSQNSTFNILSLLTKAEFVVGMHGSAMILSMFLPPTGGIVELFPFGIQPEFVSPVRALCDLSGVLPQYVSWSNTIESNSVVHPEYPALLGGISHLSEEIQQHLNKIKLVPPVECCHDPLYLYRMYQDTVVDKSFSKVVEHLLLAKKLTKSEELLQIFDQIKFNLWYFPSPVTKITCSNTEDEFMVSWNKPHNVYFKPVEYKLAIKIDNQDLALTTSQTMININFSAERNTSVEIWIKSVVDYDESIDTYSKCEIVKK